MRDDTNSPDRLVALSQAASIVERLTGRRPHLSALYRWKLSGISGQKLRVVWAGKGHCTCERWLREFFDAVTAAKQGENPAQSENFNAKAIENAERELTRAGI